jgi:hypothetical protein
MMILIYDFHLQNTLRSFTFVPTRTVTWKGDIVAYKIRVSIDSSAGICCGLG